MADGGMLPCSRWSGHCTACSSAGRLPSSHPSHTLNTEHYLAAPGHAIIFTFERNIVMKAEDDWDGVPCFLTPLHHTRIWNRHYTVYLHFIVFFLQDINGLIDTHAL